MLFTAAGTMASKKPANIEMVIDTDVFTYLFNKTKEAEAFSKLIFPKSASLSFVTVAEVYYGARKAGWCQVRIREINQELERYGVLYPTFKICREYGDIKAQCILKGCPIADTDYWIAACALHYKVPLVTNNWKHFKNIEGLEILHPQH
jgi:tRNA(fMet)-specific endonuclease VapC